MSLFKKLFSTSNEPVEQETTPWIPLDKIELLDDIIQNSKSKTQAIFKHSTRCGVSRMVIGQFKKDYLFSDELDLYYLDLLEQRNISNEISDRFNVMHESPQLLIIKNGLVESHASHGSINDLDMQRII